MAKALCILQRNINWTVDASVMLRITVAMRDRHIKFMYGIDIHHLCRGEPFRHGVIQIRSVLDSGQ